MYGLPKNGHTVISMIATKWAHLPNASHINRVFAAVQANPSRWRGEITDYIGLDAAWTAAHAQVEKQGRETIWQAVMRSTQHDSLLGVIIGAAYQPVLALIAYDDCAYMLDSEPGELAILAAFGDPKAVLLLQACKVFHSPNAIA